MHRNSKRNMASAGKCMLATASALALCSFTAAEAKEAFHVVYTFTGAADGGRPAGGLIADGQGNLFGVTEEGGSHDSGVVYELVRDGAKKWKEKVLYSFCAHPSCTDGDGPVGSLSIDAAGNLYGATAAGGFTPCGNGLGCGVVFKLTKSGKETVLHAFTGGSDGWSPPAGPILDQSGNLFGTTMIGGSSACGGHGCGTVYKITPHGLESVLYAFSGASDGSEPSAGVIVDDAGNLYGTTVVGGAFDLGVVFKIASGGAETVLHSFERTIDGDNPEGGLLADTSGNFYGTTIQGPNGGPGSLFKLTPDGTLTTLHAFSGTDGREPVAALTADSEGNLFGTTNNGGAGCSKYAGCGTAFKLSQDGTLTVLRAFHAGRDGKYPSSAGLLSLNDELYGTLARGGANKAGAVYEIDP